MHASESFNITNVAIIAMIADSASSASAQCAAAAELFLKGFLEANSDGVCSMLETVLCGAPH